MSTVIIAMHRSEAPYHSAMIIGIILAISLVLWLVLRLAKPIGELLGDNGLKQLFPVLAG